MTNSVSARKTDSCGALIKPLARSHRHGRTVQPRAVAALCRKRLIMHRIMDNGDLRFSSRYASQNHAPRRDGIHKIGGAVDWINDPDQTAGAFGPAMLNPLEICKYLLLVAGGIVVHVINVVMMSSPSH